MTSQLLRIAMMAALNRIRHRRAGANRPIVRPGIAAL